jgi:hypothetical protein
MLFRDSTCSVPMIVPAEALCAVLFTVGEKFVWDVGDRPGRAVLKVTTA